MSKPKKLPSGSWNIQTFDYRDENGKQHFRSFTADTKAEVEYMAAQFRKEKKRRSSAPKKSTVSACIDKYIALCAPVLSPTTVQAYRKIQKYAFQSIMQVDVDKLTDEVMQRAINEESQRRTIKGDKTVSPKTVKNEYGLISAAIKQICKKEFSVKLPRVQQRLEVLPEPEVIISAVKGTALELPCLLAMWTSLRMGEVRGLMYSDLHGDLLFVQRTMMDIGHEHYTKPYAKTDASTRIVKVPGYIISLIEESDRYKAYKKRGSDGFIVELSGNAIHKRFKRAMANIGLEITFHDLRHIFVSTMLNRLQIPSKIVQQAGGYSSPYVMDKVYSQSFSSTDEAAFSARDNYFESIVNMPS